MILEKTFPLIVIFLVGYVLQKKDIVNRSEANTLGKLLSTVVIPAIIINAFAKIDLDYRLISLPLAALFIVSSLIIIGYIIAGRLPLGRPTRGAFVTAFPTLEGGTIGYVLMLTAFGELGLNRIVLFDLANIIFLFTIVYGCSCAFGSGQIRIADYARNIIKTPLIWAVLIGFLLNITGLHPRLLAQSLDVMGEGASLLMMLMLGLTVQFERSYLKLSSTTILLKTSIGLLLGWAAALLFGLDGVERAAVIVAAALPPSMITLIFAEENDLDTRYVANLLSTALPVAILFFPILLSFL